VIGMTNMPEAKLAREAELCYATIALATDYDVWHPEHDAVTVEAVIANLIKNVATARNVLRRALPRIAPRAGCKTGCPEALAKALITEPARIPPRTRKRLDLLVGRHLPRRARRG
jgi:5'-methylthioadenosine phosphorylase